MHKSIIVSLLFLFLSQPTFAVKPLRMYFGLGGIYHNFQDTRFSDFHFRKYSIQPEFGFTFIANKNFYFANLNAHAYKDIHPATDTTSYTSAQFDIRAGYLRELKPHFFIGLNWDILDYTFYEQTDLSNTNNTFLSSSDFLFSANYLKNLNENWKVQIGSDLGFISLVKLAPSFTTNFQQVVVDKGNVSTQDSKSRNPFALSNFEIMSIRKQLYLRTNVELFFKKRFSLIYLWRVRTIWEQKGYPATQAQHNLSFRYHFISRLK